MSIRELLKNTLGVVNATLGVPCDYIGKSEPVNIFINKNNEVKDTHGMLVGFNIEAKIDKADVPDLKVYDTFVDDEGTKYRIDFVSKETHVSFYVNVVVIDGV